LRLVRRLAGWGHALLRFLLGVLFTQFPVGAFLLAGWGQEVLRRAALREWVGANATPELRAWPSFALAEPHEIREGGSRLRRAFGNLTGGLMRNARLAFKGLFCTYCLTLPGVALWAFSWRYGWDNSFNKGYEQAFIGPTLGISGILLFIPAMFYVPLAQAQLAVCGNVASFFRWRVVRAVFMNNLHGAVWLALAYAVATLPINFLLAAVLFRFNESADVAAIPDEQFRSALDRYFFIAGMVALPLYAWVRVTAGRVYARGLRKALKGNGLDGLRIDEVNAGMLAKKTHAIRRTLLVPIVLLLVVIWFAFVAQIYVRQFLNYVPLRGWMVQPLVHGPWLRYIPPHLNAETDGKPYPNDSFPEPPY
jgi:hypothetical protein